MQIKDLIPKHKDDKEVIEALKGLLFELLKPIIPDLLEWLQDINWPIAGPVAQVLKPFANRIIPDIIKILHGNDGIWKLWVLTTLARKTTNPELLREIERIATSPSKDEIEEEVNLEAIAILNGKYK